MLRTLCAAACVLAAGPALAQEFFTSSDGYRYWSETNSSGIVLSSRGETIYLGKSCDAMIPGVGTGYWAWDGRGTLVLVGRYTVYFPRQVPMSSPARCVG